MDFTVPYDFESNKPITSILKEAYFERTIALSASNDQLLDFKGDGGESSIWMIEIDKDMNGTTVMKFKSTKTGKYIAICNDGTEINVSNDGDAFSQFKLHKTKDGKCKFESMQFTQKYLSAQPNDDENMISTGSYDDKYAEFTVWTNEQYTSDDAPTSEQAETEIGSNQERQPLKHDNNDTKDEEALPYPWSKVFTPDGTLYYQNNITKATQWIKPKTQKKDVVVTSSTHAELPTNSTTEVVTDETNNNDSALKAARGGGRGGGRGGYNDGLGRGRGRGRASLNNKPKPPSCKEGICCIRNWPKSLKIFFVIGTLLFYIAIIGSIEGPTLLSKSNNYKERADEYPFEIQCLITDEKSIESSTYGCDEGYLYQSSLYEDFVYYEPKCSMINETLSDTEQRSIQIGDDCEDESDPEAGPLRDHVDVTLLLNSTTDCYANSNCTAITFYDYMRWKSYHTKGTLWLSACAVFSCVVFCWWCYEYCKNTDKLEAKQCCFCGYVAILGCLMPIYGIIKLALWIDPYLVNPI